MAFVLGTVSWVGKVSVPTTSSWVVVVESIPGTSPSAAVVVVPTSFPVLSSCTGVFL